MAKHDRTRLTMSAWPGDGGMGEAAGSQKRPSYRRVSLPSGVMYFVQADVAAGLAWHHLTTPTWRPADGSSSIIGGATVWAATLDEDEVAAVAWEWAMIEEGVFVIANMLAIESNIYLEAENGDQRGRLLFLARLIAGWDWQRNVRERCSEQRDSILSNNPRI